MSFLFYGCCLPTDGLRAATRRQVARWNDSPVVLEKGLKIANSFIKGGRIIVAGQVNMENFDFHLEEAAKFHGGICVGIAMGTKITLAALCALGLDPSRKTRDLIVYTEIDRCMTDAVQAITGCSLGRRSLKHVDYGKFAATFVNIATGKAVRATIREDFPVRGTKEEVIRSIALTPYSDMVILQEVQVMIPETDLPGPPRERAVCAACRERVVDARAVIRDGATFCRACAVDAYYKVVRGKDRPTQ